MSVYAIQAVDGGPVKVGYSADVDARLAQLQTSHHSELRIIDSFAAGQHCERLLHEALAEYRVRGEWYLDNPTLHLYVRTMATGNRLERAFRAVVSAEAARVGEATWNREDAARRLSEFVDLFVDGLAAVNENLLVEEAA